MRKFVVAAAVGAALAGPAEAQGTSGAARQPAQPQARQTAQSKPVQSDAERERAARAQGLSQAELYRRRESGLDEGQPLRR